MIPTSNSKKIAIHTTLCDKNIIPRTAEKVKKKTAAPESAAEKRFNFWILGLHRRFASKQDGLDFRIFRSSSI